MIQKKCDLALKKSNKISGCLNREILTKAVTLFFSALVRPQLETCVQLQIAHLEPSMIIWSVLRIKGSG